MDAGWTTLPRCPTLLHLHPLDNPCPPFGDMIPGAGVGELRQSVTASAWTPGPARAPAPQRDANSNAARVSSPTPSANASPAEKQSPAPYESYVVAGSGAAVN